ncbi:MAG: 2Fe-2S iron-sulfur cluster-binding protein, partial [Vicinamibacterales bacterium]
MDTVTLTIDGHQITVEKGKTVLEAAIQHGHQVPYYCYHPGLGVDGSCRVCIVKIEKLAKLQTACSTACADGMVVVTNSPEVEQARASVFEFLLINHPLDCPVCDKGGECPLQDFSYSFGPERSRMEFDRRVFDGEGVKADVDFGPTLLLNRNRCILCTRCVRFMREVEGDAQIGIVSRGYGSEIATFEEKGVVSLLSGNLMDVCPVGAITTRDYRFKSRPWDNPQAVDTICTLCEKGCNTTAWIKAKPEWAKGASLVRMTPRLNHEINSYWMCDIGRFDYHWVEGDRRVRQAHLRQPDGSWEAAPWADALVSVKRAVDAAGGPASVRFFVSAHASLEELFVLKQIAASTGGVTIGWRHREKPQPKNTRFHIPAIDAPNVRGAKDLGFDVGSGAGPADLSTLKAAVEAGQVNVLYVVDGGPDGSIGDTDWILAARRAGRIRTLVV